MEGKVTRQSPYNHNVWKRDLGFQSCPKDWESAHIFECLHRYRVVYFCPSVWRFVEGNLHRKFPHCFLSCPNQKAFIFNVLCVWIYIFCNDLFAKDSWELVLICNGVCNQNWMILSFAMSRPAVGLTHSVLTMKTSTLCAYFLHLLHAAAFCSSFKRNCIV